MPHNLYLGCSSYHFSSRNSLSVPFPEKEMELGLCNSRSLDGIHVKHTYLLKVFYLCFCAYLRSNPLLHVLSCDVVERYRKRKWGSTLLDNDWFGSNCQCVQTDHWDMAKNELKVKDSLLCLLSSLLYVWSCSWYLRMELQPVSHG